MFSRSRKSSNKSLSDLERSLAALTSASSPEQVDDKDFIGRYGLNLLYRPSEPLIDFVFVHGLRGGSRKTWSKTSDPLSYWPKEWLPRDAEFEHVRIHSFGYNSDWLNKEESVLNILDFGKSLLVELINSPEIGNEGNTPIVLIGHSMGGLVIKQAHILANRDESAKPLANRIFGMVFLATPHRGADLATVLSNMLKTSMLHGEKLFLADLERNSSAIASINDEFRHYVDSLSLLSFYETKKTSIGYKSTLIVDKDAAIMGYRKEESVALDATHRNMCKFDSPLDANFITIRNCLVTITRKMLQKVRSTVYEQQRSRLLQLKAFLDIAETPEDDLSSLNDARLDGSCQWFSDKKSFLSWKSSIRDAPPYYWLKGQQATGKSILAAHIIGTFSEAEANCCYYFFKHNVKMQNSLSDCLRSLAYQMACLEPLLAQKLLKLKVEAVAFDKNNEQAIWRKVFVNGIFEVPLEQPHFWVIDGLDECSSQHSIMCLLAKGLNSFPLRVFMTSRPTSDLTRDSLQIRDDLYADEITITDTRADIEDYINDQIEHLPFEEPSFRKTIVDTILEKSCGLFLWVVLVLKEMQSAFSIADIKLILEEVPPGMDPLYERGLAAISKETRGKQIIQAILRWTVCAIRPMTLQELEQALRLETGEVILNLKIFINSKCWQFIRIDKSDKVTVLHETVRAFLQNDHLQSDFAINRRLENGRIANICLRYLCSDEMKPPQNERLIHLYCSKLSSRSAFVNYACENFTLHLRRSPAEDAQGFLELCNFMERNILTWIEHVARTGNLQTLIQASKDIRGFIQARAKYYSPLGKQVQFVDNWEMDLVRLVSQFGKNLIEHPTAIFWLIPPFCPPASEIGALSQSSPRGLVVKGLKSSAWNDRISCIQYRELQTRAVAFGDRTFAVGLSDKSVKIYSQTTCQEQRQLELTQPAKLLVYSSSGKYLAVASIHFLTLIDTEKAKQIWQIKLPQECLTIAFNDKDEMIWLVTKNGDLTSLFVKDGCCYSSTLLGENFTLGSGVSFRQVIIAASFALEVNLVAVVQRGRPVSMYDIEEGTLLGVCDGNNVDPYEKDHAHMWIRDLFFRPNLEKSALAVLYHEGQLVLYDSYDLSVQRAVQTDARIMACSPNGQTLVTGDETGTIQIYDFESLTVIYKLIATDYSIRSLSFSNDGLRFIDIRGSQCNVWEPSVLVREKSGENDSVSDAAFTGPIIVGITNLNDGAEITALACPSSGEYLFCGRDNGSVSLYDTVEGNEVHVLYLHTRGIPIQSIICGDSNLVVSTDASNRCMVWKAKFDKKTWSAEGPLLDIRLPEYSIRQTLLRPDDKLLLVSTTTTDLVYEIEAGSQISSYTRGLEARRWLNHPYDSNKLIVINSKMAVISGWDNPGKTFNYINFDSETIAEMSLKDATVCQDRDVLSLEFISSRNTQSASKVLLLPLISFKDPTSKASKIKSMIDKLSSSIEHIIGWTGTKLLFLNRRFWVCSIDISKPSNEYCRHFFIPEDWLSVNRNLILKVTCTGDLVFVKKDEIAVIKQWFQFREYIAV